MSTDQQFWLMFSIAVWLLCLPFARYSRERAEQAAKEADRIANERHRADVQPRIRVAIGLLKVLDFLTYQMWNVGAAAPQCGYMLAVGYSSSEALSLHIRCKAWSSNNLREAPFVYSDNQWLTIFYRS
jgi:hypothetical protein